VFEKAEVWYRDDSPVAHLAKLIGERYGIRARCFTSPSNGKVFGTVEPSRDGDVAGPAVILADVAHQDLNSLSDFWGHPRVRLVGILPDVNDGRPFQQDILATARCFALLPSGASPDLLCHMVEAAFANMELADREGDSFERAERVREELNQIGVALSSTRDVGSLLEMILGKAREITSADAGSDDPIDRWDQDIIGRAAVVELLAEHALQNRTPVLALHGDFGDGKTSVLHLLRQAVQDRAIVVSPDFVVAVCLCSF
jgi:hypothetical protein